MAASYYRIAISNPGGLSAPSDGFIDPTRMETYISNFETPPNGFNDTMTTAKRRANQRYLEIVGQLNYVSNIYIVTQATLIPGGAYNTEPSSITVTAVCEHGDDSLRTQDETDPAVVLVGPACITRLIARALIASPALRTDVYDPTPLTTPGNSTPAPRFGERVAPVTIGAVATTLSAAEALVTVTPFSLDGLS